MVAAAVWLAFIWNLGLLWFCVVPTAPLWLPAVIPNRFATLLYVVRKLSGIFLFFPVFFLTFEVVKHFSNFASTSEYVLIDVYLTAAHVLLLAAVVVLLGPFGKLAREQHSPGRNGQTAAPVSVSSAQHLRL
jgi:hypothetical protein